jgi:hypothetical protein
MAKIKKNAQKPSTKAVQKASTKSAGRTLEKKTEKKSIKPVAKSTKKPEPKIKLAVVPAKPLKTPKGGKAEKDRKSAKIEVKAETQTTATSEEDEEDEGAGAGGGMSAAGMAMAAATAGTESSAGSLKNFRHHPDIENFYRFIFENDLRYEALEIIDVMASQREALKQAKAARSRPN